jgi:hypothetical protein
MEAVDRDKTAQKKVTACPQRHVFIVGRKGQLSCVFTTAVRRTRHGHFLVSNCCLFNRRVSKTDEGNCNSKQNGAKILVRKKNGNKNGGKIRR